MSMFLEEKKKIIDAGIKLDRYGLISLAGGNVSMRMPNRRNSGYTFRYDL